MSTGTASVDTTVDAHGIAAAIPDIIEYISRQRWSGAHDMRITSLSFEDAAVLAQGDATLLFTICRVTFVDSRSRDYALPLGVRRTGDPLAERAPSFMICSLADGET